MYKYIYSNVFINVPFINLFVNITKRSYRNKDACDITELYSQHNCHCAVSLMELSCWLCLSCSSRGSSMQTFSGD